jgi:hypothetical protein
MSVDTDSVLERGFPADGAAAGLRGDAAFQRAVTAYRFWYPTVSAEGIMNGNRELGLAENEAIGIASTGPRQIGFTLNSDTPYGAATVDLSGGPMVIELPAGAYVGLVDDHHQRWVFDMGIPGPDAGRGGKHLVLPPGYDGEVPDGYHVGRSSSFKALVALRALPLDGDLPKAMDALRAVRVYPLADAADPKPLRFADFTERGADFTCLRWEDNLQFWEVLHRVIDAEPIVDEFRPMYGLLSALGIEKGKPFSPDGATRDLLEQAARVGRDQLLVSAFASARVDKQAWPDRRWEWCGLIDDNADFETPAGLDLEARDRRFAQAIVASPAMFRRVEGGGSLYWLACRDGAGAYLDGGKDYRLQVPLPVPGKLFWSVTVYDAQTRSQVQSEQGKAALRSLFELKDLPATGSAELRFGPTRPTGDDSAWIQTLPNRGWFAYLRIYGPEQPAFDGSWKPGDIEPIS